MSFVFTRMSSQVGLLIVGGRCAGCGARGCPTPCASCMVAMRDTPRAPDAAFLDRGPVARLVRVAKRGDWRAAGPTLGKLMVARAAGRADVDVVTWVPSVRSRRARRGGHLPEALARGIAAELGVPARELLRRAGSVRPQRGLDRAARLTNVRGAFEPRSPERIVGLRILLVDDVRTTGATLRSATLVLEQHGAVVTPRALVGVRDSWRTRGAGVKKRARSVKNTLTNLSPDADGFRHDLRKAAASVRTPRPP